MPWSITAMTLVTLLVEMSQTARAACRFMQFHAQLVEDEEDELTAQHGGFVEPKALEPSITTANTKLIAAIVLPRPMCAEFAKPTVEVFVD